jgi:hypothetical protein
MSGVSRFVDGELNELEEAAFTSHAASCAACAAARTEADTESDGLKRIVTASAGEPDGKSVAEVMRIINTMPEPVSWEQKGTMAFKVCYTLYNALVVGLMSAVGYFVLFSNFFTMEQVLLSAEARNAMFGSLCILTGCIFVLAKGWDLNIWLAAHMRKGAASFQLAMDSVVLLVAGASFCVCGGILFFTGIF